MRSAGLSPDGGVSRAAAVVPLVPTATAGNFRPCDTMKTDDDSYVDVANLLRSVAEAEKLSAGLRRNASLIAAAAAKSSTSPPCFIVGHFVDENVVSGKRVRHRLRHVVRTRAASPVRRRGATEERDDGAQTLRGGRLHNGHPRGEAGRRPARPCAGHLRRWSDRACAGLLEEDGGRVAAAGGGSRPEVGQRQRCLPVPVCSAIVVHKMTAQCS